MFSLSMLSSPGKANDSMGGLFCVNVEYQLSWNSKCVLLATTLGPTKKNLEGTRRSNLMLTARKMTSKCEFVGKGN